MSKRTYSEEDLQRALEEIKRGRPILSTAAKYSIPRSTLQNRIHNRSKKGTFGPATILTLEEEQQVIDWLLSNYSRGFPRKKQDVQYVVKEFLDANPRKNPFKNNAPGNKWYSSFLRRHPCVATRTPEAITDASSMVAEKDIRSWFGQIEKYLKEKSYFEILSDPTRVYNGDETNFLLCPKTETVLAPKGVRNVYETDRGQAKENITVMFSFSASGDVTTPMIIYPYKRMPSEIVESIPEGIEWRKTERGWMTSEIFISYIKEIFVPNLKKKQIAFPVILFVDGHSTHLSFELSEVCRELQVILICLYPNSTRILQPADVSVFKPVKNGWRHAVQCWRRDNLGQKMTKISFAPLLSKVVQNCIKKQSIINGFRCCGLCPFNADAIDYTKCLGKNIMKQKNHEITETTVIDEKMINYNHFVKIVGNEKLQEFETLNQSRNTFDENFLLLFEIYNKLKPDEICLPILSQTRNESNEDAEPLIDQIINLHDADIIFENFEINDTNEITLSNLPLFFDNSGSLMMEDTQKLPIVEISDFLRSPPTPVRKGLKETVRRSYIVSSTPYKEAEEKKQLKKLNEEFLKEERKQKRIENKRRKEAEELIKENLREEKKTIKIEKAIANPKLRTSRQKTIRVKTAKLSTASLSNIGHIRDLFHDDLVTPESETTEKELCYSGLCYECLRHITVKNKGINCFICSKAYHLVCAELITKSDFEDFSCKKFIVKT